MKKLLMGIGVMLLVLAGCSQEKVQKEEKMPKQEEQVEEVTESVEETETEVEEEKLMTALEKEITKNEVTLYENESGSVQFVGYTENADDGNFEIVLKYEGELTKADNTDMQMRLILSDSNTMMINNDNRVEIRKIGDVEYHVYKSDEQGAVRRIIRVDTSLFNDIDGNFNEENKTSVEIPEATETMVLEGMEFSEGTDKEEGYVRENDKMKITLDYVDTTDIGADTIHLSGNIEIKEDMEGPLPFTYMQPDLGISEEKELRHNSSSNTLYKGTEIGFSENINLGYPLGKDNIHVFYFSIADEMFAFDLDTGEELSEVNITMFEQEYGQYLDRKTLEGFTDVNGTRIYDAIQHYIGHFNYGIGTDNIMTLEYVVGGYNSLSFKIGVAQNENKIDQVYDIYVYGDDFESVEGQEQPNGKVLYSKQVTSSTPLEDVSVDLTGVKKATIYIDTNVPSGRGDEERFIPIIIGEVKLTK